MHTYILTKKYEIISQQNNNISNPYLQGDKNFIFIIIKTGVIIIVFNS